MFKFVVTLLILVIAFFVSIIIHDSHKSKAVEMRKSTEIEVSAEKEYEYLPNFMKVKGLVTVPLFQDMNSDISYYGEVCKNPNAYHSLVGDKRIYNKDEGTLIYQYHCYQFFKYNSSMDDMKGDFLGAFLREYHGLRDSEIDKLVIVADGYVNP